MDRKGVVQVVAILCSGLMAGLLFGDWLGTSFARARMSDSSFIELQQIVHINYLRTLPALSSVAVIAPVVWLFRAISPRESGVRNPARRRHRTRRRAGDHLSDQRPDQRPARGLERGQSTVERQADLEPMGDG